ncbi:hypothetical protein TEA_014735 [Camellia sinensis var. sinensis]|uniref:Uncharacterized protein n=1 Tax=Camellia sinensis var. sinensis TaxID=542762 RepID=A0A4S4ENG9_CAMSN|nr:hypothetical protein TEA_014735 [Camellia sinensis var. sinensis]
MDEEEPESGFGAAFAAPSIVTLTPFSPSVSPSPRRLSSHFIRPNRPVRAARQLAWVSLQGRLVGAEEASSARTIGGGLSPAEAVSWELFSPIHRILVVAVVAVAAANSKKNKQICQLRKSVQLRDQVLLSMQQKLDNLCEQVNYIKDQPGTWADISFPKNVEFLFNEPFGSEKAKSVGCGCQLCDQHQTPFKNDPTLNTLAIEQDIYNLKKECEEKDATIKELSTFLHSSEVSGSKRITELEDIVRRKNMRITKLKKDMLVLEQKVVQLTRLRRPSSALSSDMTKLPLMADNLVYDMDSTTGSSSSDSDCPNRKRSQASVVKSQENYVPNSDVPKGSGSLVKPTDRKQKSRPVSPLKEISINQKSDSVSSLRPMQPLSATGDLKNRRRAQTGSRAVPPQKRWVYIK